MKHVRALTFDLDDTLWDNRPLLIAAEQALYDWLGQNYPRVKPHFSLEDLRNLRQELLRRDPELCHDVTKLRKISLRIAAGAQRAGVTVIWMNRRGQPADPGVNHHAEIRNMTELLSLLGVS